MVFRRFFSRALFALFVCLAAASAKAQNAGCNNYVPASIRIEPVFDDVEYLVVPMLNIKQMADEDKAGPNEHWPVGLSTARAVMKVQTDIFKLRSGQNQHICGQVKNLVVQLGFQENKIYIAKEFPKRSCPYKVVLAHEEMHKEVDRTILVEFSEKARLILSDAAKKIGMVRAATPNMIDEQINEQLSIEMDRLAKEFEDERRARQNAVDSAEEYLRVSQSCEGRTMETVQNRLELLEATYPGITKSVLREGEKTKN